MFEDPNQHGPAERVENLKRVIAVFTRIRDDMLQRRNASTDCVMLDIDERLKLNARTLESLRRNLALAEKQFQQPRGGMAP